jgi:endonuclease G, mitochondrial
MRKYIFLLFLFAIILSLSACRSNNGLFEWPEIEENAYIIKHTYYALEYDTVHNLAKWAAYCFTADELFSKVERSSKYSADFKISGRKVSHDTYTNSGFDRGHLIPARDMMFNEIAMTEANYMSNITPQTPSFNRGIWKSLETCVRNWVEIYDTVFVVTGPVYSSDMTKIGNDIHVSVPKSFFKAILVYNDSLKTAIAFHIPNQKISGQDIFDFSISIDSLEQITNINFFPSLTRKQKHIEASFDEKYWTF